MAAINYFPIIHQIDLGKQCSISNVIHDCYVFRTYTRFVFANFKLHERRPRCNPLASSVKLSATNFDFRVIILYKKWSSS